MPTGNPLDWMGRPEGDGYTWAAGLIPYCGDPPPALVADGSIVWDTRWDRYFWSNNADLRIPQWVRDAVQARRDPCAAVEPPPPDDAYGTSPPPPPSLPADTPTDFAQRYNEACAELNAIADEIDSVWQSVLNEAEMELGAGKAAIDSVTDEVAGAADNQLNDSYTPINKVVQKVASDAQRALTNAAGDMMAAGINVPFSVPQMQVEQAGNPFQMLTNAMPQFGPPFGMQPNVPGFPGLPPMQGMQGMPLPGMGMPPPQPAAVDEAPAKPVQIGHGAILTPEELADMGFGPGMVGPTPEPVVPLMGESDPYYSAGVLVDPRIRPQTLAPTTSPPTTGEVCCPDVKVTVVVPPIVVNQVPAGGAQVPPHQQAPPAPLDPPAGTPYEGRPPTTYLLDGRVSFNADNRRYEWGASPSYTPGDTVVNVSAPTGPGPGPLPAPQLPQNPRASLLWPMWSQQLGDTGPGSVNWNKPDVCKVIDTEIKALKVGSLKTNATGTTDAFGSWMSRTLGDYFYSPTGKAPEFGAPLRDLFNAVGETIESNIDAATKWADESAGGYLMAVLVGESTPNPGAAIYYGKRLAVARKLEEKTHLPLTYLTASLQYAFQYSNPQYIPNQIRTDDAFLAGQIDESLWECWTRGNGNLPEPARKAMLANMAKPNISDLIQLYRRGHIPKEKLFERVRESGVLNPRHVYEWLEVTKAIPTQSDLIRFMVRDASDDTVAAKYGYDDGFKEKYTGQMKEWATSLGLDDTYFRYSWRSHWDIPSYTQLTEMIARLRPDRLEVKEWEQKYQPDPREPYELGAPPKPRSVTREDVRQALTINDMAPGWVEQLIDISYTPINRTDAIRAYMTGAFSDEQLYDSFLNVRYSERDARTMLAYYKRDKERRNRNVTGSWSPRKVTSYYKQHLLTYLEAYKLLEGVLPTKKMVEQTLDDAELDMEAARRKMALATLKRQFMLGEHNIQQARAIMSEIGIDAVHIPRLADIWTIERDGRRRLPTVAMISKWVHSAIISVEEARRRLFNLGYSIPDADAIIAGALKMDYEGAPPSREELGDAIDLVVKNQREARHRAETSLQGRLNAIIREGGRIYQELQRRRAQRGDPLLDPLNVGG